MAGRANRRRGEIEAMLDGERRILCLTLGALAELETAFAIGNLNELGARFSQGGISARDIIRIVGAGLRGGGNVYGDEDVAEMTADGGLEGFARIVAELLAATFGGDPDTNAGGDRGRHAGANAGLGIGTNGGIGIGTDTCTDAGTNMRAATPRGRLAAAVRGRRTVTDLLPSAQEGARDGRNPPVPHPAD